MADRAHLSIGEVLSLLQEEFPDVTISKIRFLESQGLLDPERTPSGYRKFYAGDIGRLRWILTQQKEHFLPLKVIKDRLAEQPVPAAGDPEIVPTGETGSTGEHLAGAGSIPSDAAPIWMVDAARAAAARSDDAVASSDGDAIEPGRGRIDPESGPGPRGSGLLDPDGPPVNLSFAELASASGLEPARLRELEAYGLVEACSEGSEASYDRESLVVAQQAAEFLHHGIEARHLRMFKIGADREAGFLEQVVMPMMKQRDPAARQQAVDVLGELAALGQCMRAALLRRALRDHLP